MQTQWILQTAKVLASCLLAILLAGPGSRSVATLKAASRSPLPDKFSNDFLHAELVKGSNLYSAGLYADAVKQFDWASDLAAQGHNPRMSARARGDAGAVQLAMRQYGAALKSFSTARRQ